MITLAKVQAAVKAAPHYRVRVGHLEVIGTPGASRWTFDYVVRNTPRASDGRLFTAYGRANAAEYLEARGAYLAIEEVTLAPKCDAAAPTIASYRTHIEGRKALGYSRHGVMLFSFVPHLMGYNEPTFGDALTILNGRTVETAMAAHNRALTPNSGATADGMLREAAANLTHTKADEPHKIIGFPWFIGQTFRTLGGSARITFRPDWSPSRPWCVYVNGTALRHEVSVMTAAHYLAARHGAALDFPAIRAAMIETSRARAFNGREQEWSGRACHTRAVHSYNLACDDATYARSRCVDSAVAELLGYMREDRTQITNPRDAFRTCYGTARAYLGKRGA